MLYEMTVENDLTDGVSAISFVDSPAIQEDFILLSKDNKIRIEIKLDKTVDAKRHVVSGPILITDLIIPRNGYDIVFRKDTIRKISENFLINGNQNNITLQHQVNANKVFMIESWIVEDPKNDKSSFYGYNLPAGSWFGTYKVQDEDLWTEYLQSGILKGISIEGSFTQREINLHENCNHDYFTDDEKELYKVYLAVNFRPSNLNQRYVWKLGPNDNNCPSCLGFNNQVKTLREWISTAIPAVANGTLIAGQVTNFPYSPYSTFCEQNCKCKLVKVADIIKKSTSNPFAKK